jgi:hypothetical protein
MTPSGEIRTHGGFQQAREAMRTEMLACGGCEIGGSSDEGSTTQLEIRILDEANAKRLGQDHKGDSEMVYGEKRWINKLEEMRRTYLARQDPKFAEDGEAALST